MTLSPENFFALGVLMLCLGALGVVARRNLFVLYFSIEVMLNGVNLILATFARVRPDTRGGDAGLQHVANHAEGEEGRQDRAGDAQQGVELFAALVRRVLKMQEPQHQGAQEGEQKDPAQLGGAACGVHDQFLWASRS